MALVALDSNMITNLLLRVAELVTELLDIIFVERVNLGGLWHVDHSRDGIRTRRMVNILH